MLVLPIRVYTATHKIKSIFLTWVDGLFACPHRRRHIQTTQLIWERASQICKQQIAYRGRRAERTVK